MNLTPENETHANARNALIAGFLGWTLDAFDYFILVFILIPVARDFHESIPHIALTLTASLAMRPVGAFLFGLMADRYGRRLPLMLDVLFYSVI
ncbi:MAG: MFS transporter, partial [Candidatus Acidiferrales bacterium]